MDSSASYVYTKARFGTAEEASHYRTQHSDSRRERRELGCIVAGLAGVPRGARVLDLPCGCGRLTGMLVGMGFEPTCADASEHMIAQARRQWTAACANDPARLASASFEVRDVMNTGFADGQFDAIVCNRLLHHFVEAEARIIALRELARICKGPLVVSFFNSFALDALKFRLRNFLLRRKPIDRIPIPLDEFVRNAAAAGLKLQRALPTRWGISPQWYVVLRK